METFTTKTPNLTEDNLILNMEVLIAIPFSKQPSDFLKRKLSYKRSTNSDRTPIFDSHTG
jgi:hypothetical protein